MHVVQTSNLRAASLMRRAFSYERWSCAGKSKNVQLMRTPGLAEFPDCAATRSTRHLEELADQVAAGDRAVVLFVVQRKDCEAFSACRDLDPAFARSISLPMPVSKCWSTLAMSP